MRVAYAKQMVAKSIYPNGESAPSATARSTAQQWRRRKRLFLSSKSETGYMNVYKLLSGRFRASIMTRPLTRLCTSAYDTAAEAAVSRKANGDAGRLSG